jgi:hypothetical protein
LPARLRCAGIRIGVLRRLGTRLTGRVGLSGTLIGRRLLRGGGVLLIGWGVLVCTTLTSGGRLTCTLIALLVDRRILIGRRVLIGRRLLRVGTALAGRRGLARARSPLLPGHVRQSERGDGLGIDLPASLEALLALERDQGLRGARTEHSVRLATDVESFLDQHHLNLPDLLRVQIERGSAHRRTAATAGAELRSRRAGRDHRDHFTAVVHDDDLIANHEVLVPPPRRIDLDQGRRNGDESNARGHHRANCDREVHVIDAWYVAAGEHGLLNPGPLLGRQIHAAAGLTLLSLPPGRRLRRLILLRLGLLGRCLLRLSLLGRGLLGLLSLALLRRSLLTLLTLRGLALRLISLTPLALRCALVLVALRLTGCLVALVLIALLGLALLALLLLVLALVTLTLLALLLLVLALVTLALLALFLFVLALLALLSLPGGLVALLALLAVALLRLTRRLVALPLAVLGLRLALPTLVLRLLLRLPAALVLLRGAAGLSAARRLSAARHVLR